MPELPDVETFKRYFDSTSLHQRINDVEVGNAYILKDISARELARRLKGRRFESTRRHGKHLFARTDGGTWLRLHFGMTGSLRYFKGEETARRREIDLDEPAIDCRHRQHLRRRNSFPCPHSSGHADRASLRQRPKAPLPCNAARIGKSG